MPNTIVFPPDYRTTIETCPVCQCPDMKVQHGYELGSPSNFLHLEFCPECDEDTSQGEIIVIVGYRCPDCVEQASRQQPLALRAESESVSDGPGAATAEQQELI